MKTIQLKYGKDNPRKISDEKMQKLKKSIQDFPKMMELRPIIYDPATMEILGGNMRLRAIKELGMKEIPEEWVRSASDLTEDEQKRFVITDNVGFGEWDFDILANEWDDMPLVDWGLELPGMMEEIRETKDIPDIGEIEFSEELLLEHNYIVLYFDNPMDWEVAKEVYGIKDVKSNDPAEKCQKIGLGRVLNGRNFI